jgi:N4-gp56 family major capsid protein
MSATNFANLTGHEKKVWSMDFWNKARNMSFLNKFTGDSEDSLIQRITELKKDEKGARAVITLVNDLEGDGRAGDRQLAGYEEALTSEEQVIQIDQLRHANRNTGRMADQRTIINFREQSRNKLAYWLSDRYDQLGFLTLSGVSYASHTNGAARVGSDLNLLEFAADVSAPTADRLFTIDNAVTKGYISLTKLNSDSTFTVANSAISWQALVNLKAMAKERYLRPIRTKDGVDFYHAFLTPTAMASLKTDSDFIQMQRDAGKRGAGNELFKGTDTLMVDGIAISEYRHVYNTKGLASGSRWKNDGTVHGCRVLFCGAQALGFADIGMPTWVEEDRDFENVNAISTGKIAGFLKPQFEGKLTGGMSSGVVEDFGVICLDVATN